MAQRRMACCENLERLKEEYEKIKKKYGLPSFDELDGEFEIRKIDHDLLIVREIRRNVMSRIDFLIALLDPILDPGKSLHSFIETKFFEKYNVEPLFDFYKLMWRLIHEGVSASYDSEKAEAEFIRKVWKQWPEIKKKAIEYSDKIALGWSKVEKEAFSDKYLQ
jgi:hypothetical protein